jgi:uncharacterized protein YkwD
LRVRTLSAFLLHLDAPMLIIAGWAGVVVIAVALCRAAASGDHRAAGSASRAHPACNADSFVPRKSVVVAMALVLLAMMSSPAWASVRPANHRLTAHVAARRGPGACAEAELQPSPLDLNLIRAAILCLVNRQRAAQGERLLAPDMRLQHAAQAHTDSMAYRDYFEHVGPRGETPLSRIRAAGYLYSSQVSYDIGAHIGWGTLWEGTPQAVVAAWMASPGHRANILDARFRNTGIGVSTHPPSSLARGQAGAIYTQDFGGY